MSCIFSANAAPFVMLMFATMFISLFFAPSENCTFRDFFIYIQAYQ